ncbi:Hpt domain-containing protein [Chitiniphilus eburneus]|uniref:hybrid sensor histidine kinase/response regulator n=1 Tax=Chitiniphilus eburneus TaxID=2571148 RepID=UPI0035D115F6
MSVHTEFDQGSLVWLKGELEQTLSRATESLRKQQTEPDAPHLKHAQTHLHQAVGALEMVELAGLARFCEEIEQLVAGMTRGDVAGEAVSLAIEAVADACNFLDRIAAGAPNVPLVLSARFAELAMARGANPSGAELFFPQLSELSLPGGLPSRPISPGEWNDFVRQQRRRFEAGLLHWLRNGEAGAAVSMARSLTELAASQSGGVVRTFWWTAAGVLDAMARAPLACDIDTKQLLMRLNLQLRRLADGSGKVAERLFRDLLYVLAHVDDQQHLGGHLSLGFGLESLRPEQYGDSLSPEAEGRRREARALREELSTAKELWSRVAAGQSERMPTLVNELNRLAERSRELRIDGLDGLWQSVAQACQRLKNGRVGENEALEMATALLLADNALAIYPTVAPDFAEQADAMQRRLAEPGADVALPQLDAVSREAQEKLLLAQLAQEMRSNLQVIEEALDGYFRDPTRHAELGKLDNCLRQLQGALMMLDRAEAVLLLQLCQQRIQQYASGDEAPPSAAELEELAEGLSSLGFYVDALEQSREEAEKLITPALARLAGTAEEAPAPDELAVSLEAEPPIGPVPVEPEPQPEPQAPARPLPQSDAAIDAELLEVYLEEAVEVLATVLANLDLCRDTPHDREALTVIRRGFHTLKGSGRMVGLNHLGEVAWAVEQVLNKCLQMEQPASTALLDVVQDAHAGFTRWVEQLSVEGTAQVDADELVARAETLRHQMDQPVAAIAPEDIEVQADDNGADADGSDEVRIGDVVVSNTLFTIFRDEASFHRARLRDGRQHLAAGETLSSDILLSAHTLGGIASTAGFRPLGELAYAVEHALQELGDSVVEHGAPVIAAIDRIDSMLDAILALTLPESPQAELDALHALHDRVLPLPDAAPDATAESFDFDDIDLTLDAAPVVEPAAEAPADTMSLAEAPLDFGLHELAAPEAAPPAATDTDLAFDLADFAAEPPVAVPATQQEEILDEAPLDFGLHELVAEAEIDVAGPEALAASDDAQPVQEDLTIAFDLPAPPEAPPSALDVLSTAQPTQAEDELDISFELDETQPESPLPVAELSEQPPTSVDDALDISFELEEALPESQPQAFESPETLPETAEVIEAGDIPEISFELDEALPEAAAFAEPQPVVDGAIPGPEIDLDVSTAAFEAEPATVPEVALDLPEMPASAATVPGEFDLSALLDAALAAEPEAAPAIDLDEEGVAEAPAELDEDAVASDDDLAELELIDLAEPLADEPEASDVVEAVPVPEAEVEIAEPAPVPPLRSLMSDDDMPSALDALLGEDDEHHADRHADLDPGLIDEIDDQLLPVFIEEADELLPRIGEQLRELHQGDVAQADSLKRTLHTLKGSARMSGAMRIGEATHLMESRLLASGEKLSQALLDELEIDYDLISSLFDELTGRGKFAEPEAPAATAEAAAAAPMVPQPLLAGAAESDGKATIRVKSELVDSLVNQAGEVSIARARIESEMLALKTSLLDLTENVTRLRTQLRELEIQSESQLQARSKEIEELHGAFDPLEFDRFTRLQEVTRFIAESVNDVSTIQHNLLKNLDESSSALTAQARMTKELQQSLMRVRMVPFSSVSDRLYRLTRQTGKETGKKVNLELRGGRVEIDRGVLEKMISPFEHMLRNAIDHGLESTEERLAAGKSEFGEVLLEVRQEGNELVLTIKDDGRGLNLERIRAKGIERGLIQPDDLLAERDLMQLIFAAGFTTASSVTQLSGRGIGMDVVKNEIGNLGGRVQVDSVAGQGTTFTINLPLTLAVTQVLLVKAGQRVYAIPSVMIEQVQELKQEALARLYDTRAQEWLGSSYPFAYFPRLLGDADSVPEQKRFSTVLLLRSGATRMALHVDELVKNMEVVVKAIGPQLARIPGVAGATVLGNGDIVLIMNPLALLARGEIVTQVSGTGGAATAAPEQLQVAPVVMVVDDSLTVRKITGRLLAREGYQVVTAKDGVDGLQQLSEVKPAVMLVDIEMPRMDGFEFTRNVRANDDTRDIPIIMITSRTADKHKNYAFELGVNVFLGKPYQEDELLGHIREFIAARH